MACLGFRDGKPVFGPPRAPTILSTPGYPITVVHGCPVSGPAPRPLNVDLSSSLQAPNWNGSSDCGMFDSLALELRERIWESVLVQCLNRADQELSDKMTANEFDLCNFDYSNSMDYFMMKRAIYQGSSVGGCGLIRDNIGLLLANKQIHVEASRIFYSRNIFYFGSHSAPYYKAVNIATRIPPRHFQQIQHVVISFETNNTVTAEDKTCQLTNAFNRLADLLRMFRQYKNRIKTLQVCYRNEFRGELERLLNRPTSDDQEEPERVPIYDRHGHMSILSLDNSGGISISHDPEMPFRPLHWVRILDPLLVLKGNVEDVVIRADLPVQYVKHITECIIEDALITPAVKKMRKEREEQIEIRRRYEVENGAQPIERFEDVMKRLGKTMVVSPDWFHKPGCQHMNDVPESSPSDLLDPAEILLRSMALDGGMMEDDYDDEDEDYSNDEEDEDEEYDIDWDEYYEYAGDTGEDGEDSNDAESTNDEKYSEADEGKLGVDEYEAGQDDVELDESD